MSDHLTEDGASYTKEGFFASYPQFLERPEIWWRISSDAWTYSPLFGWWHVSHPGRNHKPQSINSKVELLLEAMAKQGKTVQDVAGRKMRVNASKPHGDAVND